MSKSKSINKELSVAAIKEGTVIDHIPADASFKVAAILKLRKDLNMVSIATNLNSKSLGKKNEDTKRNNRAIIRSGSSSRT